jgi:hypothetical protein
VKKLLITLLKVAISAAIIGYLAYDAAKGDVFTNLVHQPKRWDMLAAAWAFCMLAILLTFVRWWYLVRALDVPCRLRDAIRISFWGFLFNMAPLGIVGGDLVKAVMLGHEHPQYRAKALASVLVDRVIGLYVLFLVATTAILLTGFQNVPVPDLRWIAKLTFMVTIAGTVGLAVVLGPDLTGGRINRAIARIPRIGRSLESLVNAVRMYNRKPGILLLSSLITVGVHGSAAVCCYLIASGLPGNHLSLAQHLVVMPLSTAVQVLPVPIGPTEFALDYFYSQLSGVAGPVITKGQGLVVVLVYRLFGMSIAALGVFYYFGNRREMAEVIHEAENEEDLQDRVADR